MISSITSPSRTMSVLPGKPSLDVSTSTTPPTASATSTGSTSSSTAAGAALGQASQPGGSLGEDAFLKLLIAQLQNQDPTNPMDGTQMASQLAQFSSLNELVSINSTLTSGQTSQGGLLAAMQTGSAVSTIGHTVVAQGSTITVGPNGSESVLADMPAAGGDATLHVYDASGKEVSTVDEGNLGGGRQSMSLDDATSGLAAGQYSFTVTVKSGGGAPTTATTYVTGKVDGVVTGASGLLLTAGAQQIPFSSIVQIDN